MCLIVRTMSTTQEALCVIFFFFNILAFDVVYYPSTGQPPKDLNVIVILYFEGYEGYLHKV